VVGDSRRGHSVAPLLRVALHPEINGMMQGCQNSVCGWRKDETSIDSCGRAELRVNYAVSGVFCDITCTNSRKAGLLSDSPVRKTGEQRRSVPGRVGWKHDPNLRCSSN
jgi:hypothetical protein